jgi:hypothetical protein
VPLVDRIRVAAELRELVLRTTMWLRLAQCVSAALSTKGAD